jgi:hypothetical protein
MSEVQERTAQNVVTSENLAEFQAKRMGLAEQTAEAPQENAEAEQPAESSPETETQANPTEEVEKKPSKLERRFSDITKQREAARQEAAAERAKREALEARLAEIERKSQPVAQPAAETNEKPRPDQFSDAFEYAEKLAEWSAQQAVVQLEKKEAERKAAEQRNQVITTWNQRLQAAKAELPDFDDMVSSSEVQVSDQVRDAILDSEVGPRILYHLAENPEIGQKLASMSVAGALREIGKLEARLEKPAEQTKTVAQKSRASAPINPIRAVAAGSVADIDASGEFRGSYQQWKQMRQAGKIR